MDDINITLSLPELALSILGILVAYIISGVFGTYQGIKKQISQLYEAHLGEGSRDADGNLRWYNNNLTAAVKSQTKATLELSRDIKELSKTIRVNGGRH